MALLLRQTFSPTWQLQISKNMWYTAGTISHKVNEDVAVDRIRHPIVKAAIEVSSVRSLEPLVGVPKGQY
jgi:hypothetical protein